MQNSLKGNIFFKNAGKRPIGPFGPLNFNGNCAPKGNKFSKSAGKRPPATHKIYLLAVGAGLFREASKVAAATDNLKGFREGEGVLEFRDGVRAEEVFLRLCADGVVRGQDAIL